MSHACDHLLVPDMTKAVAQKWKPALRVQSPVEAVQHCSTCHASSCPCLTHLSTVRASIQIFALDLVFAEASCRAQIKTARAVASDVGEVEAHWAGLSGWAGASLTHSERDAQKQISKQKTRLDIPLSQMPMSQAGKTLDWIKPRSWFEFIFRKGLWHRLAGLDDSSRAGAPQVWSAFWTKLRGLWPDHEIFQIPGIDFSRTVAVFLHGDEGRSLKRQAWMVTAGQSVLGFGFAVPDTPGKTRKRSRSGADNDVALRVNYLGNTFTSRFVCSMLPKKCYEEDPTLYDNVLQVLTEDLLDLFETGLEGPDGTHRVACVGVKGDWPYLVKAGKLLRNFNTAAKKGHSRAKDKGICHACLAGRESMPYEEIATLTPRWWQSVGAETPWAQEPVLLKLPCRASNPATLFQPDIWHTFHLGIGRTFLACTMVLALPLCNGSNNDERFAAMTASYVRFCRQHKLQTHLAKITADTVHLKDKLGPNGTWQKGALTTNLMRWLPVFLSELQVPLDSDLGKASRAASAMNELFGLLFRAEAFLTRDEAMRVGELGMDFMKVYYYLAVQAYNDKRMLYPLLPKLHWLHHFWLEARDNAQREGYSLNPLATACQQDEDMVGKASRLSRRVNARTAINRTFLRYLAACHTAWTEADLIRKAQD